MKPFAIFITLGCLIYFAALPICEARGYVAPRVDRRQIHQQRRIEQGIASGRLTGKELQKLESQQQQIQRMEAQAKADGIVTRRERIRLNQRQAQASRSIYRKKHNLRRQ